MPSLHHLEEVFSKFDKANAEIKLSQSELDLRRWIKEREEIEVARRVHSRKEKRQFNRLAWPTVIAGCGIFIWTEDGLSAAAAGAVAWMVSFCFENRHLFRSPGSLFRIGVSICIVALACVGLSVVFPFGAWYRWVMVVAVASAFGLPSVLRSPKD